MIQQITDTAIELVTSIWEDGDYFNIGMCSGSVPTIWYSHLVSGGGFYGLFGMYFDCYSLNKKLCVDTGFQKIVKYDIEDPNLIATLREMLRQRRDEQRISQNRSFSKWKKEITKPAVLTISHYVVEAGYLGPFRFVKGKGVVHSEPYSVRV